MSDLSAKVVLLGSQGVGKTSIMLRCVGEEFDTKISPTIGASFSRCTIIIDGRPVLLQIWDTAGQERFRSMAPMYYRNANAAVVVFDLTSSLTFQDSKSWIEEFRAAVDGPVAILLIGNKSDLPDREVISSDAESFAHGVGAHYFETSALENTGIERAFRVLAMDFSDRRTRRFTGFTDSDKIDLSNMPTQKRPCCNYS